MNCDFPSQIQLEEVIAHPVFSPPSLLYNNNCPSKEALQHAPRTKRAFRWRFTVNREIVILASGNVAYVKFIFRTFPLPFDTNVWFLWLLFVTPAAAFVAVWWHNTEGAAIMKKLGRNFPSVLRAWLLALTFRFPFKKTNLRCICSLGTFQEDWLKETQESGVLEIHKYVGSGAIWGHLTTGVRHTAIDHFHSLLLCLMELFPTTQRQEICSQKKIPHESRVLKHLLISWSAAPTSPPVRDPPAFSLCVIDKPHQVDHDLRFTKKFGEN